MNKSERLLALAAMIETQESFVALMTASINGMPATDVPGKTRMQSIIDNAKAHLTSLRALVAAEG